MKIGIMADSHDNLPMIRKALERFRAEGAEALVHAGDYSAPFAVREVLKFDGPMHGCFGNNDGERAGIRKAWPEVCDPPHRFKLGGRQFLLTHDVKAFDEAGDDIARADVAVSAHTHRPVIERGVCGRGDLLHVNPGETGGWLTGRSTVALLDSETLEARILEL
jgi:putative phosphoesterase